MVAFHRGDEQEDIITVTNMDISAANAKLNLRSVMNKGMNTFTLTDLITNEVFNYKDANLAKVKVLMNRYSTRILLIHTAQEKQDSDGVLTRQVKPQITRNNSF
jgi:ribosomal 30S subunit maturation factor RimM